MWADVLKVLLNNDQTKLKINKASLNHITKKIVFKTKFLIATLYANQQGKGQNA